MFKKLKSKAASVLRKNMTENHVLATYEDDGVTYKVIDTVSSSPLFKSLRSLKFKTADSDIVYTHSAIYLNPSEKRQPYLPIGQDIISRWCQVFSPKSALVLGCAGCAIPRFLYLSYEDIRITGVELLPFLIDIAKKHFFVDDMSDRFTLTEGDAFGYVKDSVSESQDIILVDIFDTNRLPEEVFSEDFTDDLLRVSSENSLIIFNFLDANPEDVKKFGKGIPLKTGGKYVISTNNRCFLAIGKNGDSQKLEDFYKSLDNCEKII